MCCDIGKVMEGLENELVTYEKQWKGWKMCCDIGKVMEGLENELVT